MSACGYEPKFQSALRDGEFGSLSGPLDPNVRFPPISFSSTPDTGRGTAGRSSSAHDPNRTLSSIRWSRSTNRDVLIVRDHRTAVTPGA